MIDGLNCLWHHAVIGCNHQHHNVGDLCTTHTHLGECRVTWGVDECDLLAIFYNLVCTNVLCNAACFTSNHICFTNTVQQCCFTVVNVTHHCDDWWTWLQQFFVVIIGIIEECLQFHLFLLTWINKNDFCSHFKGEQFHLLIAQTHGCGDHLTVFQQETNDVSGCAI
ncbi:unannotated protein [freshwater metagenome]|uniref:Unannotated protein n=1 Tax=freshwater metagenome TaxID=449393 RepID=A0A6J6DMP4_9ZZZZ